MPGAEPNLKSATRPFRLGYYGWFLLTTPVLLVAGTGLMIFLAAKGASEDLNDANPTVVITEPGSPVPVEFSSQQSARYSAAGQPNERKGGFGKSRNFPRHLTVDDTFGTPNQLSVLVADDETACVGEHSGLHLRIVNRSSKRAYFSAIDSQLYLVQEAMNDKGEWQAIERLPEGTGPSDCAEGYHRISLEPGQYWEFVAPCYGGPFPTKLRFRLDLGAVVGDLPQSGGRIIYSNEFAGSVALGQFIDGSLPVP